MVGNFVWTRYATSAGTNDNRITINAPTGYLNLAKGFGFNIDPNNQSSDGYPLTTPASNTFGSNPNFPLGYYGSFIWKWSGTGGMQWSNNPPLIVTSGGLDIFELNAASGDLTPGGNCSFVTQNLAVGATNPRIVFSVGWNIQAISNNGSGLIRITTKTGLASSVTTGLIVNISGANANTGANGIWTIAAVDNQNFDLQLSTFTNSQASPAGTAIYAPQNNAIKFLDGFGTSFSGMADLVVCRSGYEAAITGGQIVDTTLIDQLKYLMNHAGTPMANRGWLRFMDMSGVQASYECDFSQRIPTTYLSYTAINFRPGYWVNAITNSGSDAYTCSNPSNSGVGAYVDNEIVQGQFSATNTGGNPTLNVNGRGAKVIYGTQIDPRIFRISAPAASAGLSMVWTFNATWLNGGSNHVFTYVTVAGDTDVSVNPGTGVTYGVENLNANLVLELNADAVLATAGEIQFGNSAQVVAFPRTAQDGALSITYTSGPAICTMIRIDPSAFAAGTNATFVYNYLLDGFIYRAGGLVMSAPFEAIIDMCNQVGAHCWFTWGTTKGAFITAVTDFFATNLTAGLKFGTEVGNELWNVGASPFAQYNSLGQTFGFAVTSNNAVYSYGGLRTIQYQVLSKAAWLAAGRSASDHYIFQPSASFDVTAGSNFDTFQLKGASLDASANTIYGAHGGLNGSGASPSYNVAPNRPVDITTATGKAPYWGSPWFGGSATDTNKIAGTVAEYAPPLQAALDYANGLTATAFASMANQFNSTTLRSSGASVGIPLVAIYGTVFTAEEALCAQYDSYRAGAGLLPLGIIDYEGGPQWGMGASAINGVNSVNSTDIAALATRMTDLGWNVSAYTVSGTNDKTEMATQIITMTQAWKYDATYKDLIKTHYYQAMVDVSEANRETRPAQYSYAASSWCLFPVSYFQGNQYQSYDAIHEFNA